MKPVYFLIFTILLSLHASASTEAVTKSSTAPYNVIAGGNSTTASFTMPAGSTLTIASGANIVNNGTATGFGGGATWGSITGTLANQTDLQNALNTYQPLNSTLTGLSALTLSGTASSSTFLRGDGAWATPQGTVYTATAPITLTSNAFGISTGTTSSTVAIGNDARFPASVSGLRFSSGAGSTDVAANSSQVQTVIGAGVYAPATGSANYLQPANNLSELTSPSYATVNLIASQHQGLMHWAKALNNVAQGTGRAKLAFAGDSTTAGATGPADGTPAYVNVKVTAYPEQFAKQVNTRVPCFEASWFSDNNPTAGGGVAYLESYDPRITSTGTWVTKGWALGGIPGSQTAGSTLSFSPSITSDTAEIYWYPSGSGTTYNVSVDGGGTLSSFTDSGSSNTINKVTVNFPPGVHTLTLTCAAGATSPFYIVGEAMSLSTAPGIEVYNLGAAGATLATFTGNTAGGFHPNEASALIQAIAPDNVVMNCNINDMTNGTTAATYTTEVGTCIGVYKTSSCDLMWAMSNHINNAADSLFNAFQAGIVSQCATAGIQMRSLGGWWGSFANADSVLFMCDYAHPTVLGYLDDAKYEADFLVPTTMHPLSINGAWGINLNNQAFCFEGDSITAGYMLTTPAAQRFSTIFSQLPFALNHGKTYNDGVASATIEAGSSGGFTTTTTASVSSGNTIATTTSGTTPAYPVAVDPGHLIAAIPYGTTGTWSGTNLILSNSITGTIASGASIVIGGNNITDRFPSQIYPHRPTLNGGDGGPRAFLFVLCGINDAFTGKTAAQIESYLSTYYAMAESAGFTVVASPMTPRLQGNALPAGQETVRQNVNQVMRANAITANYTTLPNMVLDYSDLLDFSSTVYSSDGLHPNATGHMAIAIRINSLMIANGNFVPNDYGTFTEPLVAQQGLTSTTGLFSGGVAINTLTTTSSALIQSSTTYPMTVQNLNSAQVSAIQFKDSSGNFSGLIGTSNASSTLFGSQMFLQAQSGKDIDFATNGSSTASEVIKSSGRTLFGTSTDDGVNQVQVNGSEAISGPALLNSTITTVSGTTSGSVTFTEPMTGTAKKEVIIQLSSLVGSATYNFPTAFVATPVVPATTGLSSTVVSSLSTTAVTVTESSAASGTLLLEGR